MTRRAGTCRLPSSNGHDCRFPVGASDAAVGRHLFCGNPAAPGSSYCAHHAERSVGEGTRGEQQAAKTLEVLGRERAA
ncbi:GcrA family cell cycle regulator [Mesorhizobium xinjiangense]|uniref:GcrA family cell cycle regulator n=1 Tax=Mesorhizobium xinjiangense TaxID=2678685 RepID=UPI002E25CD65